jgi:hypothetical protein
MARDFRNGITFPTVAEDRRKGSIAKIVVQTISMFYDKKLSTGSDPQPQTATDRQTNGRDRMKTGATLYTGYGTPV